MAADPSDFKKWFGTFAHDLQRPLGTMLTINELLSERLQNLPDRDREYLSRATEAGRRMKTLIRSTSQYVALATPSEDRQAVNLKAAWDDVLAEAAPLIRDAHLVVELDVDASLKVKADQTQLKQAFHHLLSNAVKFRKRGAAASVAIHATAVDGSVRITVADQGIGFEEKFAATIFEPFTKLHPQSEYEGPGLGLAIVHKIVGNHGGRVYAQGKLGQSARFIIEWPRV